MGVAYQRIGTCTPLPPPPPQDSITTDSATLAWLKEAISAAEATRRVLRAGLRLATCSEPLLCIPDSVPWSVRGFPLRTTGDCQPSFETEFGVSADPSIEEVTVKLGSLDKYKKLRRAYLRRRQPGSTDGDLAAAVQQRAARLEPALPRLRRDGAAQ